MESFASLEAAIDALAEEQGIAIDEKHWRRSEAATQLNEKGVLPKDLSGLHRLLEEERWRAWGLPTRMCGRRGCGSTASVPLRISRPGWRRSPRWFKSERGPPAPRPSSFRARRLVRTATVRIVGQSNDRADQFPVVTNQCKKQAKKRSGR
ncbi:MAG: hypothetical protein JJE35_05430 [Thermoleophilia bacterium]|nr:hypothetical protein [Thermoleophilia bacterium]